MTSSTRREAACISPSAWSASASHVRSTCLARASCFSSASSSDVHRSARGGSVCVSVRVCERERGCMCVSVSLSLCIHTGMGLTRTGQEAPNGRRVAVHQVPHQPRVLRQLVGQLQRALNVARSSHGQRGGSGRPRARPVLGACVERRRCTTAVVCHRQEPPRTRTRAPRRLLHLLLVGVQRPPARCVAALAAAGGHRAPPASPRLNRPHSALHLRPRRASVACACGAGSQLGAPHRALHWRAGGPSRAQARRRVASAHCSSQHRATVDRAHHWDSRARGNAHRRRGGSRGGDSSWCGPPPRVLGAGRGLGRLLRHDGQHLRHALLTRRRRASDGRGSGDSSRTASTTPPAPALCPALLGPVRLLCVPGPLAAALHAVAEAIQSPHNLLHVEALL